MSTAYNYVFLCTILANMKQIKELTVKGLHEIDKSLFFIPWVWHTLKSNYLIATPEQPAN